MNFLLLVWFCCVCASNLTTSYANQLAFSATYGNETYSIPFTHLDNQNRPNASDFSVHSVSSLALTASKLKAIFLQNPKSIVRLVDSKTFVVLETDLRKPVHELKALIKKGARFTEYSYTQLSEPYIDVETKLTVSPCLTSQAGGTLDMTYALSVDQQLGIGVTGSVGTGGAVLPIGLSFDGSLSRGSGAVGAVSGRLSCTSTSGVPLRFLISPSAQEYSGRMRFWSLRNNDIAFSRWTNPIRTKVFTENQPMFYCAQGDYMDLRCEEPVEIDMSRNMKDQFQK